MGRSTLYPRNTGWNPFSGYGKVVLHPKYSVQAISLPWGGPALIPVAEPSGCLVYVISLRYSLLLADPEIWDSPALQRQTIRGFRSGQLIYKGEEEECPAVDNNISAINWQQLNNRYIYIYIDQIAKALIQKPGVILLLNKDNKKNHRTNTYYSRRSHNLSELFSQPKQSGGATVCSSCQSAFAKGHTWHQTIWMHCSGSVHILISLWKFCLSPEIFMKSDLMLPCFPSLDFTT